MQGGGPTGRKEKGGAPAGARGAFIGGQGEPVGGEHLELAVQSESLVDFGDGIESDRLELTWGQSAVVTVAEESLRLVV